VKARCVSVALAVVLVLAGAGSVIAASGAAAAARSDNDPFVAAELKYLGIDKATLVADMKRGQTLAQIARSQGKSPQGLIDALVAVAKVQLDAKVKAGTLRKAKEAAVLAQFRVQVSKLVRKPPATVTIPSVYVKPILAYLQIDEQTLRQELKSGKSLAQIAVEHGKTAAGLSAAILKAIRVQLDAQVAAGKLSASDRDALFAQARKNVAKFVAGTG
jgi:lambda repressor-like predicted transcriptional regulator